MNEKPLWQVKCDLGDGRVSKLVTRSWLKAALEVARCKLKGRPVRMSPYQGEADRMRRK